MTNTVFDPPTLVAANLEAKKGVVPGTGPAIDDGEFRVGVIGSTRAAAAIALAICPPEGEDGQKAVAYTIANAFSSNNQLAKLDLRTGAATLVGSPIAQELAPTFPDSGKPFSEREDCLTGHFRSPART